MYNWRFLLAPEGDEEWLTLGARMKFNACLLWKSITGSQLGRFTCDEWARLWWVRENKVSPASLASISTPLRFPHANTNTLTYFVSSHKKGILCKIICYSHQPLCVSFCVLHYANTNLEILQSSRPVWAFLRWCLCSTPDLVCSKCREWDREIQRTSEYFHFLFHILTVKQIF